MKGAVHTVTETLGKHHFNEARDTALPSSDSPVSLGGQMELTVWDNYPVAWTAEVSG